MPITLHTDGLPGQPKTRGRRFTFFLSPPGTWNSDAWGIEIPTDNRGPESGPLEPAQDAFLAGFQPRLEPSAAGWWRGTDLELYEQLLSMLEALSDDPPAEVQLEIDRLERLSDEPIPRASDGLPVTLARAQVDEATRAQARAGDLERLDRLVALQPGKPRPLVDRASRRLCGHEDPAGCLEDCEAALQLDPNCLSALMQRSAAWRWLGEEVRALEDLERVAALEPARAEHHVAVANQRWRMGRLEEALEAFDLALQAFAAALPLSGNRTWTRALDAPWRRMRAEVLFALGRLDEAQASLDEALERQPTDEASLALRERIRAGQEAPC